MIYINKHYLLLLMTTTLFPLLFFVSCKNKPPKPPTITGPSSGYTNTPITFMVQSTDPNKDEVAYQFSWGDGTRDTGWTPYFPSGQPTPKTHIYTKPGNYGVMAKAKDTKDNESDWSSPFAISIANQAPNTPSQPSGPTIGMANTSYTFSVTASDPDGDSIAIRFDWGNEVISDWSNYVPSGRNVSITYAYQDTGRFLIKAQAKDVNGDTSGWSSPLGITIYPGWITIMTENFESGFPGSTWSLSGDPTWGSVSYRKYQGERSGWCAGSTRSPSQGYAPNMYSWMIYGPFSLTGATDALVSFYRWVITEQDYDYLWAGASIDGNMFYRCYSATGNLNSWEQRELDLTNVEQLGNLCGRSEVWIAFLFVSDGTIQYEGAYLDNIVLMKYIGAGVSERRRVSQSEVDGTPTEIGQIPEMILIPKTIK